MHKILITGGAGFIGYHLAKHLAEKQDDVTVCDNLFRGKMDKDFLSLIKSENVKFVEANLTNQTDISNLKGDYDIVYHLAAINGTKYFYEIPHEVLRVNILCLINILDWFVKTDNKKLVFTSSSETYAGTTGVPIPTPEDIPLSIDNVLNPRFSYAASKIVGELFCINYAREYGFNVSIVRPHNIYGPRMGYEHVIPEFIQRTLNRENPFKIYGGKQTRAFCFIDDFVKGIELVGKSPKANGEIFNLGNDKEEITMQDLSEQIFEKLDFQPQLEIDPAPKGSVMRRCPDVTKARKLLGYVPEANLEHGLEETIKWYSKEKRK